MNANIFSALVELQEDENYVFVLFNVNTLEIVSFRIHIHWGNLKSNLLSSTKVVKDVLGYR